MLSTRSSDGVSVSRGLSASRSYHSSENITDGSVTGGTPQQVLGAGRPLHRQRRTGGQSREDRESSGENTLPDEQTPSPPQQDRQPLGVLSNSGPTMSSRSMGPSMMALPMMAPSPLRSAGNLESHDYENAPPPGSENAAPTSLRITAENARPTIWSEWHAQLTQAPNKGFGPKTSTPNNAEAPLVTPNDLRQYCWISNNNQPSQPTARRLFTSPQTPKIRPRRREPILNSRSRTLQLPAEPVAPASSGSAADIELLSADIYNMRADDTTEVQVEEEECLANHTAILPLQLRPSARLHHVNQRRRVVVESDAGLRRQRLLGVVATGSPPPTSL